MDTSCDGRTCVVVPGPRETYTCAVHGVHECGATRCNARYVGTDGQVVCQVTGRTFHAMWSVHPYRAVERGATVGRSYGNAAVGRRRTRPRARRPPRNPFDPTKRATQRAIAHEMVFELLYGRRRTALAATYRRQATDRARRSVARFARRHGGREPTPAERNLTMLASVINGPMLPTVSVDHTLWETTVTVIMKVWSAMANTPYARAHSACIHFPVCVLGCVYLLRDGLAFAGRTFVPQHAEVARLLPPVAALHRVGFRVKDVTMGKNHIVKACRSSVTADEGRGTRDNNGGGLDSAATAETGSRSPRRPTRASRRDDVDDARCSHRG